MVFSWLRWKRDKPPAPPEKFPDVIITRVDTSNQGTFGLLQGPKGFLCKVGELPWRENETNYSCIPAGRYTVTIRQSPRFGTVYHLRDVEGRTYILMHSGNLAGDRKLGFRTHTAGCLLLGRYFGKLGGQKAVMCSRPVVRAFLGLMGGKPFIMEIREEF